MFKIGCHLSVSNGYLATAKTAVQIGANTFQYFSRNPRGGSARAVDYNDIRRFNEYIKENSLTNILAHAPYVLNACSLNPSIRAFTKACVKEDLLTMENFDDFMYNFHPGSHANQGAEKGIELIIEMLNEVLPFSKKTTILLEAMAGKGSEVGRNFKELRQIIDGVNEKERVKVLIDTCHIFSAGYDIVNNLDGVLEEFDSTVGLKNLKAIHLNDSLMPFASKKDRHALIGEGEIGLDAIARIINHKSLKDLPFYLETPNDDIFGFAKEISLLKSLRN